MPYTAEEKRNWERQAYGMEGTDFVASVEDAVKFQQPSMLCLSILSDAQEVISRGDAETGRQFINRAKFVLMHYLHRDLTESAT